MSHPHPHYMDGQYVMVKVDIPILGKKIDIDASLSVRKTNASLLHYPFPTSQTSSVTTADLNEILLSKK